MPDAIEPSIKSIMVARWMEKFPKFHIARQDNGLVTFQLERHPRIVAQFNDTELAIWLEKQRGEATDKPAAFKRVVDLNDPNSQLIADIILDTACCCWYPN